MGSYLEQPDQKLNIKDKSVIIIANTKLLNNISEYDKAMIDKYQSQIINETLQIQYNRQINSLKFMQFLNIHKLVLCKCQNIIPKLESQTISILKIICCNIQSVKDMQLDNLEVLELFNDERKEAETLAQEIVMFYKLKVLRLERLIVDITPLQEMINLTQLTLYSCQIRNIEALKPLVNLKELHLGYNYNIDITALQFLKTLIKLSLTSCCLISLDIIEPLTNLQELDISYNKIVYIAQLRS
ncbi:leucine-rich_repeat domain-containing protein [Hexamita inflata]|uniref:Leucine-rich repeat domain-containing protein n=1 Tax=Hexamita inflata TaxID=28002 RepID=A0AA86UKX4_9EUKA|nr:leucine-rich repeat domain-containing protein [Hexamita inflata]